MRHIDMAHTYILRMSRAMTHYLVLALIIDAELFARYIQGHIPTIIKFGGKVTFRSVNNTTIHGSQNWDAIALQEWPDTATFEQWWNSEEYRPWAEIRDKAAAITIVRCDNPANPRAQR